MCPQCAEPLIILELEGIEVDYCPKCRGTWLDTGELELIGERAGAAHGRLRRALTAAGAGTRGGRKCPRCRRRMRLVRIGEKPVVELDRCPAGHGLWLDAGELGTIMREYTEADDAALAAFLGGLFGRGEGVTQLGDRPPGLSADRPEAGPPM